jgi:teichuronic acid biosynthesis glycosyltransferase TuaC
VGIKVLWTTNEDPKKPNSLVFILASMQGLQAKGFDVHLEFLGSLRSFKSIFKAVQKIRKLSKEYEIVHAQYGSACGLVTGLSGHHLKFITIRGSDWVTKFHGNLKRRAHQFVSRLMTAFCLHKYKSVISVSKRLSENIEVKGWAKNIKVLPSAIDLDLFHIMDRLKAREIVGEPHDDRFWILFTTISTANPTKRYELALDVFEKCNRHFNKQIALKVVSGVPHSEIPFYVAACDLILCTSETEGWPNSIKEAMACGLPFVSTDVSDLKEIAQYLPGCRVCEADSTEISQAIIDVLQSYDRRRDGPVIRAAINSMGLKESAENLANFYHAALSNNWINITHHCARE